MRQKHSKKLSLREKLAQVGVENLDNTELLAIILSSGSKKRPVIKLAEIVVKDFSLSGLHHQSLTKLTAIPGLGRAKASQILAAVELGKRSALPTKERLINPQAVLSKVSEIRTKTREHTICLYLNGRHELLHQETIAIGGLNYSLIEARDVFGPALKLPAASVILVHNHPSGSIQPSQEDLRVTKRLLSIGEILGITLLDHLIVTKQKHVSLRELGHLHNHGTN